MDNCKKEKIFNIYSILFIPLAFVLFILNIRFGVSYADSVSEPLQETSYIITFLFFVTYAILSLIQIVLFFVTGCKKPYFGIAFLNLLHCAILMFLTIGGMLILAFGFIIAAPILLTLIILWLISCIKTIIRLRKSGNEIEENNAQSSIFRKIFYCVILFIPIVFIIFVAFNFYGETVEKYNSPSIDEVNERKIRQGLRSKNSLYKQVHQSHKENSEKFYNALKKMNIKPKNKTPDKIFNEYKKEFLNKDKYIPILGNYDRVEFGNYNMKIFYRDSILYNAQFYENLSSWQLNTDNNALNYHNCANYSIGENGEVSYIICYGAEL